MSAAPIEPGDDWSRLPITREHADFLAGSAITPDVAQAMGVRSVRTAGDLPEPFRFYGERAVPALVFPWQTPDGEQGEQLRPDSPIVVPDEERPRKYLWAKGSGSMFGVARVDEESDRVVIVEGTKQTLACASYIEHGSVYGVFGCRAWSTEGVPLPEMTVVEDKHVVVIFDADLTTNVEVWTAAERLEAALKLEGALSVKFARLVAGKKAGLDDVLGARADGKRGSYLRRLIEGADKRPAKKPAGKVNSSGPAAPPTDPARRTIVVNDDRHEVLEAITETLVQKWDRELLFNYGKVIGLRTGHEMKQLDRDHFGTLIAKAALTGSMGQQGFSPCWPDGQTLGSALTMVGRYSRLEKIARAPFVRLDGSICQTPGYDEASATYLVMNEQMERVNVPDEPTEADVREAVRFLVEEWLVDFWPSLQTPSDRANLLALCMTPLIRGLVPLVPWAVINGKQAGVGKNLLVDGIALLVTGEAADPLPWTRDDEETRKTITGVFKQGADLVVFDEAHVIEGASTARALTTMTWKDRLLGGNQMAEYPNRVTWLSMGNGVQVNGDMSRRVYQIALRPTSANPEDRPEDDFVHVDFRGWTREHRADILSALLTLVRAWYADGCPRAKVPPFGSFEAWSKLVGGILAHAGVEGFLSTLVEWRSETDTERIYWQAHLEWLQRTFKRPFTTAEVTEKLRADPMRSETPPEPRAEITDGQYPRRLGQAYGRMRERTFGTAGLGIAQVEKHTGHAAKWTVVSTETPSEVRVPASGSATTATTAIPLPPTHTTSNFSSPSQGAKKSAHGPGGSQDVAAVAAVAEPDPGTRVTTPTLWVAEPAPEVSPVSSLLPLALTPDVPRCRDCQGDRAPVPPAHFWWACPACHPATFERA